MFLSVVKILMQLVCGARTGTGGLKTFTFWFNSITVTCNSFIGQFNLSFRSPSFQLPIIIEIKDNCSPSCKAKVWKAAQRHDAECIQHALSLNQTIKILQVFILRIIQRFDLEMRNWFQTPPIETYRLVFLYGMGESGYRGVLSVIL